MKNRLHVLTLQRLIAMLAAFALFSVALTTTAQAQIRAGGAYLKLNPGTNAQALAGSVTGTLDHMYAVYANPAATSVLREWQWSVAYTKWIPEIYHAALFYGQRIRTPWSPWTRFYASVSTLGVPEFDSSNGRTPGVSGNDLLLSAGIGNTFAMSNHQLSWGGGLKYLRSELDNFNAGTVGFDIGALYRTPNFEFMPGFLDEGIFSIGVSLTQIGQALKFETFETPLPQTFRAGVGFDFGRHQGIQTHLSLDFLDVRDESSYFTIGGELSYAQMLTLRAGYSFEKDNLLQNFAFGVSLGLDDLRTGQDSPIPGKNNMVSLDLSGQEDNTYFESPYRGTFAHKPIRPEAFQPLLPEQGSVIAAREVDLSWEYSREPDLFDAVRYWLMVDSRPDKINRLLHTLHTLEREETMQYTHYDTLHVFHDDAIMVNALITETEYNVYGLPCSGNYYWAVVAFDKDQHFRIMNLADGGEIAHFRVSLPNLQITSIAMSEETNGQESEAALQITVHNAGPGHAGAFQISVQDSAVEQYTSAKPVLASWQPIAAASATRIDTLAAGSDYMISLPWQPRDGVRHHIAVVTDPDNEIAECNEDDNRSNQPLFKATSDVSVTKAVNKTETWEDDILTYSLTVTNHGPDAATGVTLVDKLPAYTSRKETPAGMEFRRPDTLFANIGEMAPGETRTFNYELNVRDRMFNTQMRGVNFKTGSAVLTPESTEILRDIAPDLNAQMAMNDRIEFFVDGHTDSVGNLPANYNLSLARAGSVRAFLVSIGEWSSSQLARLKTRGYGETSPLIANDRGIDRLRRMNRRVELSHVGTLHIGDDLVNRAVVNADQDRDPDNNEASTRVRLVRKPEVRLEKPCLDVQFANNSFEITPASQLVLDETGPKVLNYLLRYPTMLAVIEGHTSAIGRASGNLWLSGERAKAVRAYLVKIGIPADRIYAKGYGECRPLENELTNAVGSTAANKNRRIELHFKPVREINEITSEVSPCNMPLPFYENPDSPCADEDETNE